MALKKEYINIIRVTAVAVTLFFSCDNSLKEVQKVGVLQTGPAGQADNINLKYTEKLSDTGKIKANLLSPKMLDFSNRKFSFSEFPKGIHLTVFDENRNKSVIISDYAIFYNATDLIDLQGNVILATNKQDTLFADQLYYDQKSEWLFTNGDFTYKSGLEITKGKGFDADSNFKNVEITDMSGIIFLDE